MAEITRTKPVIYSFGAEGREACWSALTSSMNRFQKPQKKIIPPLNLMSDNSHDSSSSEIEEEDFHDDTTASSNSDVSRKLGKSVRDSTDHPNPQKRHRFTKHSSWSIKSRQSFRQHYKQLQQHQHQLTPMPVSEPRPQTPATPLPSIDDHMIQTKCDQIDCWPKDAPFDGEHTNFNNNTINNNNSYYDDVESKKKSFTPVHNPPADACHQDVVAVVPVVEHIIIEKQLISMADAIAEDPSSPLSVTTVINDGDNDNDDNESSAVFTDAPLPTDSNKNYCMGSTTPLSSISSVSKRHTMELLEKQQSFKYERKIKEIDNNIVAFSKSFLGTVLFVVLFRLLF